MRNSSKDWDKIDFDKAFLPGIAIDTVIFGFHDNQLMALLMRYKNTDIYGLPGGFIEKNESVNDAASSILKDRTGLHDIFLEQFYTFGDTNRHDTSLFGGIFKGRGLNIAKDHFLLMRFISISYYALVDFTKAVPAVDGLADECNWHDLKNLPPLMQDHRRIIEKALFTLQENLDKKLVYFNLLPGTFTMGELQALYETILDKKLLRTSFQRKMLNLGILKKVGKKKGVAHRAPHVYKFNAAR